MTLGITLIILGFILGLGAVTVIDIHGFLGRKSAYWTVATTRTHKVTKPLIWIGITLFTVGVFILYPGMAFFTLQLIVIIMLLFNGLFLSFYVSKQLIDREKRGQAAELLPMPLEAGIGVSFIISVVGWWGSVGIFVFYLSQLYN